VGTSGYSYKEWKGSFYPDDIKPPDMLSFYASQLSTVEINNTFYRLPKTSVLENWAQQVPETFRFAIKASRRITHMKRLKEADEETGYLLDTVSVLGARLGCVLYQLPPNMKKDMDRLRAFTALLGPAKAVFEFRHESWLDDEVYACLKEHGCAVCLSDVDDADEPPLVATAGWGYLRLRRAEYDASALERWMGRLREQPWDEVFVYFKHEDEGSGPRLARTFADLAE
jgi:uncharacterized protein YecE (DUF72 family)